MFYVESDVSYGARGLARGSIFDKSGTLVASIQQEALIRPSRKPAHTSLESIKAKL